MDFKVQKKTLELLYKLLEGSNGIVPFVSYYPQKESFPGLEEVQRLKRAAPESQGISSAYLQRFLEELMEAKEIHLHGIMVVRNGCVLAETAVYPHRQALWHATYSLCKSITGIAVGMLIDEGRLSLDDKVVELLTQKVNPFIYLKYKNLTIRHLLTMTSGAALNEAGSATEEDWVKAYLESHVRFAHGSQFSYNSMNSYMLSAILTEVTGQTMMEYLDSRLWKPLGIRNVYWESCPLGRTKGGWGLYLTMEDMAKIGQMYLQKGLWRGQRIVSEEWIGRSCQKRVDTGEDNGYSYGFHNWILEEEHAFLFNGMLGQNMIFYPEKRMFLITVAGNDELFADGPMMKLIRRYFGNHYWPEDGREPDPAAYERLKRFEGRCSEPPAKGRPMSGGWAFQKPVGFRGQARGRGRGARRLRDGDRKKEGLWESLLGYVDGKTYRMDTNKGALVPRFLQAVHNNYSEGITSIGFARDGSALAVYVHEGERAYAMHISENQYGEQRMVYHREEYRVAVAGSAAQDEDGRLVLKISLDFLETPHSRRLKCCFSDDAIRIRFEEQPGWELIQKALAATKPENSVFVQGLVAKLDPEYMNYKIRTAVETEVTGREVL